MSMSGIIAYGNAYRTVLEMMGLGGFILVPHPIILSNVGGLRRNPSKKEAAWQQYGT
jgi:hypothetical protein